MPYGDSNPYHDPGLADVYSAFGYEGTYFLVARDLPKLIGRYVDGGTALDFACGAGRSTRLLKSLGFDAVGVDTSRAMLASARRSDPDGAYHLIGDDDLACLQGLSFDLVLSAFPFSSTNCFDRICRMLVAFKHHAVRGGCIIVIEPTPEFYTNEWFSFTSDFFENSSAKSGDPVLAAFRTHPNHAVTDFLWTDRDYRRAFKSAGLRVHETLRPLGRASDPYTWISEQGVAPWVMYALGT